MRRGSKNGESMFSCCMGGMGLLHVLAGVGVGMVLVDLFKLENLMLWGLFLIGVTLVGHFMGKMK